MEPYRIVARLRNRAADVQSGSKVLFSQHGATRAHLVGLPYFRDDWLTSTNLAQRWAEDRSRTLDTIDGSFLLLVETPEGTYLVNDKVSPLTWYWARRGDEVIASNHLRTLAKEAGLDGEVDYRAYRYHIETRGTHFDQCVVRGANKLLKGHFLDPELRPTRYYSLPDRIRRGSRPEDYFDKVGRFLRQTLAGKRVAVLASNGFDSRLNCLMLSRCVDRFDVFTLRNDNYSEHRAAAAFLRAMPRQNFTLHTRGHSMSPALDDYTPRRLYTHASTYLSCYDDIAMNKEHFLFTDVFEWLRREGVDVLINGCYGDSVRRLNPLTLMYPRKVGWDERGTSRTRELFGVTDAQLAAEFAVAGNAPLMDALRERLGNGQTNYAQPFFTQAGVLTVSLPICTAEALETYRGIDRASVPGRGGINIFRDFIHKEMPGAAPVPYDNFIAAGVAAEQKPWHERVFDTGMVRRELIADGIDADVVDLVIREREFLNLWAWRCAWRGDEAMFRRSLEPLARSDAHLWPPGLKRSAVLAVSKPWHYASRAAANASRVRDPRHGLNRLTRASVSGAKTAARSVASAGYGVIRKTFGLPSWSELTRRA